MQPSKEVRTVGSILASVSDEAILTEIPKLYWKEDPGLYVSFLVKLRQVTPKPSLITCALRRVQSSDNPPEAIVNVVGLKDGSDVEWAIEYEPWAEWLSMIVDCPPDLELTDAQILANIFYEMTWAGFEEDEVEDQLTEIKERAASAQEMFDLKKDDGSDE